MATRDLLVQRAGQWCGGLDHSPPHPSPPGAQDLHCEHVQQPGRRVGHPQPAFKTPATVTALGTVWPGPGCVFPGHPRSPRSAVLRGQLHFLLPSSGGHRCQPCLPELMLPIADPSVSPTHQAGHRGPPQGMVSQRWHFSGQLWAPGPRTRGWTEGRRCTGIHCGGKDSVTQLQRHGVQGGERAGVAPQRPGGREEGGRGRCLTRPPCLAALGPGPLSCSATTVRRGLGFPSTRPVCGDPSAHVLV